MSKIFRGDPFIFNHKLKSGEANVIFKSTHNNTNFEFHNPIQVPYIILGKYRILEEDNKLKFKKYNNETNEYDTKFTLED